jgi:hypothetical protein
MKRLMIAIAATTLFASAAMAEEGAAVEEQAAAQAGSETAAAAEGSANLVTVPEGVDPEEFWPDRNDPDKYKESIKWGVTPVLDQIDADHSLGLKQHD